MSSSVSVFSDTLQEITNTKLEELSKRRIRFEEAKSSILSSVGVETDAVKRLLTLSYGVKDCFGIQLEKDGTVALNRTKYRRLEVELKNLDRFLGQARNDPSVSAKMLGAWEQSLIRHLDMQSLQFQYASLYGELVTEWLSGDKKEDTAGDVDMGEAFEDVGDALKLESRVDWENTVFTSANVDTKAIKQYLDHLFGVANKDKKSTAHALESLRNAVYTHESQISTPDQFTVDSLKWVLQGLRSSELLSDEKREVLKDFENNEIILKEIADVLNMRINALGSWAWNSETPVPVEMRRKISGIYNIHMHEDLLQAIFLQYIGVKWSVFFKNAFRSFRRSGAWKSTFQDIPRNAQLRLGYYLGPLERSPSLQVVRNSINRNQYFMAQLMDHEREVLGTAEGEEEAEYERFAPNNLKRKARNMQMAVLAQAQYQQQAQCRQVASKAARKSAPSTGGVKRYRRYMNNEAEVDEEDEEDEYDSDVDDDEGRRPMALKQKLLHLLSTEITINTHLYGEITALHSVFDDWNPKLPHDTVFTILKYFGVSDTWIGFFRKFLEAPLKFIDDDDSTPARKRRRGAPAAHVLSDVFGETTLFCLDFSVNQSTSSNLWRVQDSFWFWSHDHKVAVKAWETVDEFTSVTGVTLNSAKTGSVHISKNPDLALPTGSSSLPEGEIRWGFLRLSPQTGRFEIDQAMVDSHIEDLYKQLRDKRKNILGFIQGWNTYAATFFTSNFGKVANCFGRAHVDKMLATHERIERQVFSKLFEGDDKVHVTSVAEYLKKALGQRFGIKDVPDGYLYFPMELGGLDLQSPFISLLQIHDEVIESPSAPMTAFDEEERYAYDQYKKDFYDGTTKRGRYALDEPDWTPESTHDCENFMSFEEFTRYREAFNFAHFSQELYQVFRNLMKRPKESSVGCDSGKISSALDQLRGQSNLRGIEGYWQNMDAYWCWVTMMYGPEIVDRFGGLNIVNPGLLPIGMVTLFRDKRVKWQG